EVLLHRTSSSFLRIRFGRRIRCGALISCAPVIKHPRQVVDLLWSNLFYATKRQIIVLRTFEPDAKTTDTTDQIGSVDTEVGDEVLRQKELWVPIGLKIRIRAAMMFLDVIF